MHAQRELFATWADFDDSFFIGKGVLRGGLILIWSSSDDMINAKITEIFNSYEKIIEIIIKIKNFIKKKKKKKKNNLKTG